MCACARTWNFLPYDAIRGSSKLSVDKPVWGKPQSQYGTTSVPLKFALRKWFYCHFLSCRYNFSPLISSTGNLSLLNPWEEHITKSGFAPVTERRKHTKWELQPVLWPVLKIITHRWFWFIENHYRLRQEFRAVPLRKLLGKEIMMTLN